MKLFCAYAFTGEDIETLTDRIRGVVETLKSSGHQAYCNRFNPIVDELQEKDDIKAIFKEAFKNLEASDALVAIVSSPSRSIGQIMEIGIAMSQGKPVYLFEHKSAEGSTYLPRLADRYFKWNSLDDLLEALKQV